MKNPKINPLERRIMQRDTGNKQERNKPRELRLGDEVLYKGRTWKVHNYYFETQEVTLSNLGEFISVKLQDLT